MIVYGYNTKNIASKELPEATCDSCQKKGLYMFIGQQYAHIFWIPFFPYKRSASTVCQNCQQVVKKKDFSGTVEEQYERLKSEAKTPVYLFAGLIIVLLLGTWFGYNAYQKEQQQQAYLAMPEAGDMYLIKNKEIDREYPYILMKITEMESDTAIYVVYAKMAYNLAKGVRKDIKSGATNDTSYFENTLQLQVDHAFIHEMDKQGAIQEIYR